MTLHDQHTTDHTEFEDLAHRLAANGPAAVEHELRRFLGQARERGATPLLVAILADADEPDIVRQRAFGRILTELQGPQRSRGDGDVLSAA
jgi:hypothetical protein